MQENHDPWTTVLAGSHNKQIAVTVRDYAAMLKDRDRAKIAALIRLRFSERYLDPVLDTPKPNGFAMLAICCLMVEALESFRHGWKSTEGVAGGGEAVFGAFFRSHGHFKDLRPVASEFYAHVRCGILHQAETTGCWTVNRGSELFSMSGTQRRVSGYEFVSSLIREFKTTKSRRSIEKSSTKCDGLLALVR